MAAGTGRAAFAVLVFRSAALLGWMRPCAAQSEVVGPSAPLVAPLGGEVVLPCSLQPAVDVYGLTVEWARPDLRPKYVSVWSNGEFMQAYENPAFSGRKSLFTEELRRGNISLKLSDLRPSDQGSYRCYVPNLDGLAIVDLLVVDPGSSRTAVWLAVLPVVGVLAAVTALWVLWRRTRLKRKKQQDAEAGGEESRGRPLLEGKDQQDEDRSKENSSQVQLHTVTPAAEHLDPQKPAAEHLDLQTLRDVGQKPDAENTNKEETETGRQDGNREGQTHSKQKGGNKGGDLTTGKKIKKLFQRNSGKKADKEKEDQSLKTEGKHDESKGKKTKEKKEKKGGNKVSGVLEQTENKEKQIEELKQPLMEGENQQDEDRSKANSSQVQLHTVTPAAEHLDLQTPAAEHLDPQTPAAEHLDLQALRDVRQKPDAEDNHEEETETGGQDGNGEGQTHPEQEKGENKRGDLKTGTKIKKLFQRNSGKKADKGTGDQSLKDEGKHGESKGKKTKERGEEKEEKKGGKRVSCVLEQTENKEKQKEELKQPLLEGGDKQDEDRSKANSSQVQLHTVTPAAEHLDLQTLRDVRQKPDAEETHEEETETGGQDGNRAAGGGTETNQNQEEGKHGEKEEKKKQSLELKIQQKEREENKWGERVSRLLGQIEDRENRMAKLEQRLKEVEIQLKNTEEDLKKTEEQTETPQEEKGKAVKALSDRREELQKKKEDVQKKLEKREKDIDIMKKELGVMTGRKNKATAEKTELIRELEELREAEASSSQTEEQRTLSTHNASGQQEAADR